jgi:hypothetical protein
MVAKRKIHAHPMSHDPYRFVDQESGRQSEIVNYLLTKFDSDDSEFTSACFEFGQLSSLYGIDDLTPEKAEDVINRIITRKRRRRAKDAELDAVRRAENTRHDPIVYYMRLGNRVKIGTTTNLPLRREAIQSEEVMVIEDGGYKLEASRHRQFADLRTSGEWFRWEEPLISHIERLRATRTTSE